MLSRNHRRPARDRQSEELRRTREQLRPGSVRGGGDAKVSPDSTEWFDGEKTRRIFIKGYDMPSDDTYLPPPKRPSGMSDKDFLKGLKEKLKRRRQLT